MTLCSVEIDSDADDVLRRLTDAFGARQLAPENRVLAGSDSRSPQEGLALLAAYVGIADPQIRQAILDLVMTVAQEATSA